MANKLNLILIILFVVIAGGLVVNISSLNSWTGDIENKAAEEKEASRPANLKLTIIAPLDCPDCWDVNIFINALEKFNVLLEAEDVVSSESDQGKELIKLHQLNRLPAIIIAGEIEKEVKVYEFLIQAQARKSGEAMVFETPSPPYVEVPSGEVKGLVELILISDENCEECYNVNLNKGALANFNVLPKQEVTYARSSDEGRQLISQYNIQSVPTIILKGDVKAYETLHSLWPKVGTIEPDGSYVLRELKSMGTYHDLVDDKVVKQDLSVANN